MAREFPKKLATWKAQAASIAASLLNRGDLFEAHDPYLVADEAEDAFEARETPKEFVQRVFAEDIKDMEKVLVTEAEDFYGERIWG